MRKDIIVVVSAIAIGVSMVLFSQLVGAQGKPCAVSKSWGAFRGGEGFLTFEAADGTIRVFSYRDCSLVNTVTRSQ